MAVTDQWDAQDEVKAIGGLLKARGIPTWMDIDGCASSRQLIFFSR